MEIQEILKMNGLGAITKRKCPYLFLPVRIGLDGLFTVLYFPPKFCSFLKRAGRPVFKTCTSPFFLVNLQRYRLCNVRGLARRQWRQNKQSHPNHAASPPTSTNNHPIINNRGQGEQHLTSQPCPCEQFSSLIDYNLLHSTSHLSYTFAHFLLTYKSTSYHINHLYHGQLPPRTQGPIR